ncbi:MAG: hypothetical protein HZB51_22115 [Chloroflexi bacterium]|nr:hypothetical protein [Chloroflexota bacterium]
MNTPTLGRSLPRKLHTLGKFVIVALILSWIYNEMTTLIVATSASHELVASSQQLARLPKDAYVYYFPFIRNDCSTSATSPVNWDSRLGPGGKPLLENVRIISATVTSGQQYWRVVTVIFQDIYESDNDHTIYVKLIDENCNRVSGKQVRWFGEGSGEQPLQEEKAANDLCNCNYGLFMFGDIYSVLVNDVIPSDTMAGMIMPMRRHVNYRITFQRVTQP